MAPLDWGLGHVTRCIPIIKELINQKCIVVAAVSGVQKTILYREFPDLTFVDLPGYDIKYGKNRALTVFQLFVSIPKILIRINREKAWLKRFVHREQPDWVISDNRYGLHDPGVLSVFITHQLSIRTPLGAVADRWVQRMNYSFINRFDVCWVPDLPGKEMGGNEGIDAGGTDGADAGLAGALSHPEKLPATPVRYIGCLSRFGAGLEPAETVLPFDLLVLLSGPEPQRTVLEKRLLDQLADYTGKTLLVRGLPDGEALMAPPQVTVYNHVPAAALEALIRGADQIICRSGYSTVMDLIRLGKRAIYIPTPGQTEQEYLGDHLASAGWGVCIDQKGFSLSEALAVARAIKEMQPIKDIQVGDDWLKQEIQGVLSSLRL